MTLRGSKLHFYTSRSARKNSSKFSHLILLSRKRSSLSVVVVSRLQLSIISPPSKRRTRRGRPRANGLIRCERRLADQRRRGGVHFTTTIKIISRRCSQIINIRGLERITTSLVGLFHFFSPKA